MHEEKIAAATLRCQRAAFELEQSGIAFLEAIGATEEELQKKSVNWLMGPISSYLEPNERPDWKWLVADTILNDRERHGDKELS